jgi:hypothetical protein
VTDANGCTSTTSITITEPAALVASSSATAILCNGGSSTVTVSATGGTAPYTGEEHLQKQQEHILHSDGCKRLFIDNIDHDHRTGCIGCFVIGDSYFL